MAEPEDALTDAHSHHVAAVYATYGQAEAALRKLHDRGIPFEHLSLVGKDFSFHAQPVGFTSIGRVARQGGRLGALWGGLLGLLIGVTVFFSAGGAMVVFGPLAYAVATAIEGAAFGGLAGVLVGWGLRHEKAIEFEQSVQQGQYLVVVSGDEELVGRATLLFQGTDALQIEPFGEEGAKEPA
ncbi:conserved protein of unknown function [Candidatus Hydrogenisulfobacillus filiaventi]|uniref:DUF1269 domain-containing protein n=1 Tax=Candidatus Hydrogenisulfobacillus filiaventi TaxID=2707344 RepID=A0A6F8ZCX4_9FIRM|nr:DUF1269 domain-containing protein [Bacillota bacterium]CAB1127781.1 conserved protein of unknown function [Candidatus Hydrogenisulfobacillus filiaventi]